MGLQRVIQDARKRLGKVPLLRVMRDHADLLIKYGSLLPERVALESSSHVIFVDPRETRGRAILRNRGTGQPVLKRVWRDAIEQLEPTIVLDVGANYGEFIFAVDYPQDAIVIGIEADPRLSRYLQRSREVHPHRDKIELSCALAAAEPGEPIPFYVDADWSGRSSALRQERHRNTIVEMVATTSIDALVGDRAGPEDRLVFKIDVEGFEPQVLDGMEKTLATVGASAGVLEFNTDFLRKQGLDPEEYLAHLKERFWISMLKGNDPPMDLADRSLRDVTDDELVADIIVATDAEALSAISSPTS